MLILAFTFNACSSEDDEKAIIKSINSNPLEWVGIEHNMVMEEYMILLEKSRINRTFDNIDFKSIEFKNEFSDMLYDANKNYYPETEGATEMFVDVYDQIDMNSFLESKVNMLDKATFALNKNATTKDKEFTQNLLTDIFNFDENNSRFNSLSQLINHHEQLILAEEWDENETYALGAVAVAKHSNNFWSNYPLTVNKMDRTRAGIIVGADTAGYVAGGVVGGISGTALGPAGSVGGVIGGKFVGAWIGSGAAATGIAIYDAFSTWF